MNYAVIDLGSNTIRLCIYHYEAEELTTILNQKETAGLAGYVINGVLSQAGIEKACMVIASLKKIAERFAEEAHIYLFATASLRNIDNSGEAEKIIFERTGMSPDILSGEDEALLDFIGASYGMSCEEGILIDIGGASTEIVQFKDQKPLSLKSMPVGCLSLYSKYVYGFFPDKEERSQMKREVRHQLEQLQLDDNNLPLLIGVGGTLRATRKLSKALYQTEQEDRRNVDISHVKKLYKRLKDPDRSMMHQIYKTIPDRALTYVPGLIILMQAIKKFGSEQIMISDYGVREGYLLNRVLKVR